MMFQAVSLMLLAVMAGSASAFNIGRVGSLARKMTGACVIASGFAIAQVQDMPNAAAWVNVVPPAHADAKSVFEGEYTDPNHPDGLRKISVKGKDVTLVGTDSAGGKQWVLQAKESEGTIFVDFSPKGGPKDLLGVYDNGAIKWPDGNSWTKKQSS